MTAETDIAAINDGGANTAAEARTAYTSVLWRADHGPTFENDLWTAGNFSPAGSSLPSGWSEYKGGSATTTIRVGTDGRIYYTASTTAAGADQIYGLFKALPAGSDFDVACRLSSWAGFTGTQYVKVPGFAISESNAAADAATVLCDLNNYPNTVYEKYTAFSTRASTSTKGKVPLTMPLFFRITAVSSTYSWYMSHDAQTWVLIVADASLGFTPANMGVVLMPFSAASATLGFTIDWMGDFS